MLREGRTALLSPRDRGGGLTGPGPAPSRPSLRDERGFTLVELAIASAASTLLVLVVFAMIEAAVGAQARIDDRVEVTQRGREALDKLTGPLRSQACPAENEPAIEQATPDTIDFWADLGGPDYEPERRSYVHQGDAITLYRLNADGTVASQSQVVDGVAPPSEVTMLRYHAYQLTATGVQLTELVPGGSGLTAQQRSHVVKVDVALEARSRAGAGQDREITLTGEALVRNADDSPADGTAVGSLLPGPTCVL